MSKLEDILYLLNKKETRIELCEKKFKYFVLYYGARHLRFPNLAKYHLEWFKAVDNIYDPDSDISGIFVE